MIIFTRHIGRTPTSEIIELIRYKISNDLIIVDVDKLCSIKDLDITLDILSKRHPNSYLVLSDVQNIPTEKDVAITKANHITRILQNYNKIILIANVNNSITSKHAVVGGKSYLYAAHILFHIREDGTIKMVKNRDDYSYNIVDGENYKVYLRDTIIDEILKED